MATTTCTQCGKLYESGSEEQANETVRSCPDCRDAPYPPQCFYQHYDNNADEYVIRYENEHGDVPVCVTDDPVNADILVAVLQGAYEVAAMVEMMNQGTGPSPGFMRGMKNAANLIEASRLKELGLKPLNDPRG